MRYQTKEEMIQAGASPDEAAGAVELFELLKPALKIKSNGRVDTIGGDKTPLGLYRTVARIFQTTPATAADEPIDFTRITNDVNGNPRYVCHFLELVTDEEMREFHARDGFRAIQNGYALAVQRARKIGGRKYTAKSYGGGVVFQSHNIDKLTADIKRVKGE